MAESDDPAVAAQRLATALARIAEHAGRAAPEPQDTRAQEMAQQMAQEMKQRIVDIAARLDLLIAELRAALADQPSPGGRLKGPSPEGGRDGSPAGGRSP